MVIAKTDWRKQAILSGWSATLPLTFLIPQHCPEEKVMEGCAVIRPGHWERAQISEMGIIGS
jgi:hypothetical protein